MSALLESLLGSHGSQAKNDATTKTRAVAWARVSTDMQEERGLSLPEQLRQIKEYAETRAIEIVAEYHEAASAFRKESQRVEFHKMLERAKSDRSISAILVHDYSRFSRDSLKARMLIRELRGVGIKVISLNDLDVDPETVAGVYIEAITFAKNEAYSREVAFHTKKGCRANVQTRDPETGWCYKNGGQPLWGYRSERLMRGEVKKGRPLIKSIWVPDDTMVAGKTVHEWARHCLVELAAKGATLDELRDFCNQNGIPAPRQQFWGHTTWNSLLHPHCLLQYAGYGVWNVRGKTQRVNPPSEWVVVDNAHEALISEETAQQIMAVRKGRSCSKFNKTSNRTHSSPYLLSGGLFKCSRCGANLVGFERTKEQKYYVCNSVPNRRGLGCGPGVFVPQQEIEREVFAGLQDLMGVCVDTKGFVRQVNAELKRIWEQTHGYDPNVGRSMQEISAKIDNIRQAIEDGLSDAGWANARLAELISQKDKLSLMATVQTTPPQIDASTALALRRDAEKILSHGTNAEKKRLVGAWVDEIKLAPESLEVEICYKIPEPVVDNMGAAVDVIANYRPLRIEDLAVKKPRKL